MTSQTLLTKEALRPRNIVGNVGPLLLATGIVFAISPAMAQQYVVPVVQQPIRVPVNRIQAPGYAPPPPVVRRPWWFTVQTVSGPGAVVPIARVTNYRPQPFRFPANASVLAGKPILPPEGTPPAWLAYFAVEDVDKTAEAARESGATIFAEPFDTPGGRIAVIRDPQGAFFTIIKLVNKPDC